MPKLTKFLFWLFTLIFGLAILATLATPYLLVIRAGLPPADEILLTSRYLSSLVFYLLCGGSASFILWQARGILRNLTRGEVFIVANARFVGRGSWGCFVISAAALYRVISHALDYEKWTYVLMEYNTLFVPVFAVAGLLCLVVASLFESAARLKQDNDLVI